MVTIILKIFDFILFSYSITRLLLLRLFGTTVLNIIDIDNTISRTWQNFERDHKGIYRINFRETEPYKVLIDEINNLNGKNFVLSARFYSNYFLTRNWLRLNKLNYVFLILVPKAEFKLKYFAICSRVFKNVRIYDDLSHNHERGEVQYYDDLIIAIRAYKNVEYFDYTYLVSRQIE